MGNCLNTASRRSHRAGMLPEEEESLTEMRRISQLLRDQEDDGVVDMHSEEEEVVVAPSVAAEGLKVKIVLTRGELEWLMAQLKSGEQRLEDVLHHMHAAKGVAGDKAGWRPRLESIIECPE